MRQTAAVLPDEPDIPSPEDEETKRQRLRNMDGGVEAGDATTDVAASSSDCGACDTPDCNDAGCDIPGCDGCDLLVFVRLSSLLLLAAAVLPETGGRALAVAFLGVYRRWLTRYTPACPATPSCSAYAVAAVETLGVRHGLVAAAARVRGCRVATGT